MYVWLVEKQKARKYFDGLSNSREGARHMADKALETQVPAPLWTGAPSV